MPSEFTLTLRQKNALMKIYKMGRPYATIPTITAEALLRLGYVERSSISPMPASGTPVHLTIKGRTWCQQGGPR